MVQGGDPAVYSYIYDNLGAYSPTTSHPTKSSPSAPTSSSLIFLSSLKFLHVCVSCGQRIQFLTQSYACMVHQWACPDSGSQIKKNNFLNQNKTTAIIYTINVLPYAVNSEWLPIENCLCDCSDLQGHVYSIFCGAMVLTVKFLRMALINNLWSCLLPSLIMLSFICHGLPAKTCEIQFTICRYSWHVIYFLKFMNFSCKQYVPQQEVFMHMSVMHILTLWSWLALKEMYLGKQG